MKKNGFTVVELLTTFVLITIVVSLLITISTSLSKIYSSASLKTELFYKQSVISNELNKSFIEKEIKRIDSCGDKCIILTYSDDSTKEIKIDDKLIHIGDNTYDIVKYSTIGDVKIELIYSPVTHKYKNDTILNIKIPIFYKNIDGDFGINLVYQFNRTQLPVTLE